MPVGPDDRFYNPYADLGAIGGSWRKTQFHAHFMLPHPESGDLVETTDALEGILREYRSADYALVAQSSYAVWVDTTGLGAQMGIATLNGQEYVDYDGLLLIGTRALLTGSPQDVIDQCVADGGFVVICHPNQNPELSAVNPAIPPLLTKEMSRKLTGPVGVEIYNGCLPHRGWNGVGFGSGLATDYWDEALTAGRVLWGFATDDSHDRHEINQGWTDVYAASTALADVRAAAQRGSLVACRGMRLYDFRVVEGMLVVEADLPYTRERDTEYRFIGTNGGTLGESRGTVGQYRLTGQEQYVRVQARAQDGSMLWTQPLLRIEDYASGLAT